MARVAEPGQQAADLSRERVKELEKEGFPIHFRREEAILSMWWVLGPDGWVPPLKDKRVREALNLAIANGPKPAKIKKRYSLKDQHGVKNSTERVFRRQGDTVVLFSSSPWNAVHLYEFYPPDRGRYRFRISASGFQSSGQPVTYRVDAGLMGMAGKSHLVGYFDAPADKPAVERSPAEMSAAEVTGDPAKARTRGRRRAAGSASTAGAGDRGPLE